MMVCAATSSLAVDLAVPAAKAPEYGIVGWGGWIFNPSIIVGAVYDDNIYRSQINRIHSWGTEVIPSFTAELNEGIYRTSFYGTADARWYTDIRAPTWSMPPRASGTSGRRSGISSSNSPETMCVRRTRSTREWS
jgi:hypothetical protein